MFVRHWAIPALAFAAITAWWLFPILSSLSEVIPGAGAGDNVTFVWNVWWMRYVLHHPGQTFFFTPYLFHPTGVDLTLHTHTALPALLGSAMSSPIAGQNAVIVLHIYLNFVCSYALAHRVTRQVLPSMSAALIFGTSTFVSAHLNGHFNLIAAWTLPLVCVLALSVLERASWVRGVLLGIALAATAYTDYYLFVYAIVIVALFAVSEAVRLGVKAETGASHTRHIASRVVLALVVLLILDAVVIAAILLFPGDRLDIGPIRISLRSVRNPITVAWILSLTAAVVAACQRVRVTVSTSALSLSRSAFTIAAATTTALLLPLLIHAAGMWRTGGYVSQTYFWRSGPAGIDAATLFLASPFHPAWGGGVTALYNRFHIDVIESSGWMPLSALALVFAAILLRRPTRNTAPWVLTGTVFGLWALGPWLTVLGRQTPLMLPAIVLRFVPVIANARIPGRAMVVTSLVVAVLAALGLLQLLAGNRRARTAGWCCVIGLIVESIPLRPPLYRPVIPSTYAAIADAPVAGAVCELPMGLRDGFGERGSLDEEILLNQTVHNRPLVGGFVARLPPAVAETYSTLPVLRSLLQLSSDREIAPEDLALTPTEAAARLSSAGVAYVVLDLRRASPNLVRYVRSSIDLRAIGEEAGRIFYEVPVPNQH